MSWLAIPAGCLALISTMLGGLTALHFRRELQTLIALTGGIVVAVALFDVLPEAFEAVGDARRVGALGAAGLSVHSLIDGLGIGLAFGLNTATGVLVFVAVVTHDFADGLNTVGFVLRQGGDVRRAFRWLSIDAAAPLIGAIVGSTISISEHALGQLLAVYAGFFLYMGATDLLPEAHSHPSRFRVALTVGGMVATYAVARLAA
jgi:zinc transporter ZupT